MTSYLDILFQSRHHDGKYGLGLSYIFIEFGISVQCSWSRKFEIERCLNFPATGILNWNTKFNEHVGEALIAAATGRNFLNWPDII